MLFNLNDKVYYNGIKSYIRAIEFTQTRTLNKTNGQEIIDFNIYYYITEVEQRLTANELTNE